MNQDNASRPAPRKVLAARRLTLLASVAGLGIAVLLGGPNYHSPLPAWTPSAQAAEASAQHPAGFADLVAKVKPAVISVRVKIDRANTMSMNEHNENNGNGNENTPFDQFFRQFGLPNSPGMQRHQTITGEGSGFFISADGYAVTNNHVVDHARSVEVTTDDGAKYTAKV